MGASTYQQALLRTAARIGAGGAEFTAADLVVEAWMDDPYLFGLRGYEAKYPDANRVLCKIYGSGGMVQKGLLEDVSTRVYRITDEGARVASIAARTPSGDQG